MTGIDLHTRLSARASLGRANARRDDPPDTDSLGAREALLIVGLPILVVVGLAVAAAVWWVGR